MKKGSKEAKVEAHGDECGCEECCGADECCGECCGPVEACGMHYCKKCGIAAAVFGLIFLLAGLGYLPAVLNGWVIVGVFLLVAGLLAMVESK